MKIPKLLNVSKVVKIPTAIKVIADPKVPKVVKVVKLVKILNTP